MCLTMKDNGIGSQSHNEHQLVNELTDEYLVCQGLHENFLNKFFDKQDFGRHHFFFINNHINLTNFLLLYLISYIQYNKIVLS